VSKRKTKVYKEPHPIQPLMLDKDGVYRFKENAIVRFLLNNGGIDMNKLATLAFSANDREQFAQLIGYSLRGFSELSYVSDKTYKKAASQIICIESIKPQES